MKITIKLGLRNRQHTVDVMVPNGETRPVLGTALPRESNPRAEVLRQWGIDEKSPRHQAPETIDAPLPQRSQTILSYQVDPALRKSLNNGTAPDRQSRLASASARANLDNDDSS